RQEQDDHVLDAATDYGAHENPQRAGQIPELRSERGADERTRSGYGGEVMAEDHPAMRRDIVATVVEALGRRGARGIRRQHLRGDPGGVETVAEKVDADRRGDDPERIDGLAAI